MSKHFELLQELEREQSRRSESIPAPVFPHEELIAGSSDQSRWATDEALRLVQQIFLQKTQDPPRVVVFAGVDHRSGCSQISASVAEVLAKHSTEPVCLVEANFRSPALPEMFGTTNHHGLADALRRKEPISSFVKPLSQDKLWLLSSGKLADDSPELFSSSNFAGRITQLRQQFDFVVIDAPPLTHYSDAVAIAKHTDGLVLVLEANSTRKEAATAITQTLRSADIPILGAVLNKRTFPIPEQLYRRI
ncbi:CpsD/CapB family tyrosine-protein kinase [Acidicapsa dinghuensis]|uniref:CpsD/CapB family tyrosine-protein kinase n=1 Tax=Acidicapsa dinghuensis TaxID=2218256 RepID=A0ABW1EMI1_9BACT|nr:CpsD/CapB family tyrosine-protein kinase [Acidicapsa dinghuensis]